jgi:hypothetical protein
MPDRTFGEGDLRVRFPSTLDVREATRTRSRSSTPPSSVDAGLIEDLLQDSNFELVAPLAVRPKPARGPLADDASRMLDLELTLRGDEGAVVLMDWGGYWSWHVPPRQERALDGGTATAAFELEVRPPAGAPVARGLIDGARAFVLRFSAPIIAGAAIKVLEAGVNEGLIHITSTDPESWARVKSLSDIQLPEDRSPRILLFVHGAFSSTVGGFGSLTTEVGKDFLERAIGDYDTVIGFDHRTLSMDPLANAKDLLKRLSVPKADGSVVDVICHSRGGLVVRSLAERLLPTANWSGSINRIIFVGVPNAGTNFAEPDRWSKLADVYTTLLMASAPLDNNFLTKAIAGSAIKGVGTLVKYLAAYAVDGNGVPGLAAMEPDGDFIVDLNRPGQPDAGQPWFVISSDFHAAADGSKLHIIEGIVDDLLDEANDLVVDTRSMAAIDTPLGGHVRRTLDFGTNSLVYHTNYFQQAEVADAMGSWLFPRAAAAPTIAFDEDQEVETPRRGRERGGPVIFRREGGGGAPPPEPPGPTVQAHVAAEMRIEPIVGEPTDVRVLLSRKKIKVSTGAASSNDTIEVGEGEVLTVQIVPKRNVTVVGNDIDKFALPPGNGVSEVSFVVKPLSAGTVVVRVIIRRSPTEIAGTLTLKAEAGELDDAVRRQKLVREQIETAASTSVDLKDAVWLEISELERPDHVEFLYDLRLPDEPEVLRYTKRLEDRATYAANLFKAIEGKWREYSDKPDKFMEFLQETGAHLYEELFPQKLQEKLWQHRNQLKSILLLADEPYFPWELVHLKPAVGPLRGRTQRFLGQYGLLRWQFLPFPPKPELRKRPGRVYSVCPDYVDPALRLEEILAEADYLSDKFDAIAVRASEAKVRTLLRNREVDILHFSGHGVASTQDVADAQILLRGRKVGASFARETISATTVAERGQLAGKDGSGPLVVLNACQVGISGVELSSLGGFARAFLEAGAQAFVSCLWSVKETPSRVFVETLYDRLLKGDSISEAAVRARTAARDSTDDAATWLAFVIYARPDARFVRG